jgi:hypothetical protein
MPKQKMGNIMNNLSDALIDIALNQTFNGHALRVAIFQPCLTNAERDVCQRYLKGEQQGTDHIALQEIANKVKGINV